MSDTAGKGSFGSKDYDLEKLEIINSGGQSIDIRNIFVELEIFQDIYSSVMHGSILINDAKDIFSSFYFCGNEYIKIIVDKPGLDQPINKIFRIYKTSDRKKSGNASQAYILYFCSDEFMISNTSRISKAYIGAKASDIVYDILSSFLLVPDNRISNLQVTSGVYDFIVPGYRPFEAIQWAAARSYNDSLKYCYFFFENTRGFNFTSLQDMYSKPAFKKLKYEIKNAEEQDASVNRDSMDRFRIINDFDHITSIMNGAFASKLLEVDIFSRQYTEYYYSMQGAENDGLLLNQYKPINGLLDLNGNSPLNSFDSYYATYAQINDTTTEKNNSINKWLMPRAQHMSMINLFKFKATLPGDTQLNAGDIVEFTFPKFDSPDESGKQNDPYRTAKYLVSAVNHKFTDGSFITIAEFCTDSFAEQLPKATDVAKILQAGA